MTDFIINNICYDIDVSDFNPESIRNPFLPSLVTLKIKLSLLLQFKFLGIEKLNDCVSFSFDKKYFRPDDSVPVQLTSAYCNSIKSSSVYWEIDSDSVFNGTVVFYVNDVSKFAYYSRSVNTDYVHLLHLNIEYEYQLNPHQRSSQFLQLLPEGMDEACKSKNSYAKVSSLKSKYSPLPIPVNILDSIDAPLTIKITTIMGWKISDWSSFNVSRFFVILESFNSNRGIVFQKGDIGTIIYPSLEYSKNNRTKHVLKINKEIFKQAISSLTDSPSSLISQILFLQEPGSRNQLMGYISYLMCVVTNIFCGVLFCLYVYYFMSHIVQWNVLNIHIDGISYFVAIMSVLTAHFAYFYTYNTLRLKQFKFSVRESQIQKRIKWSILLCFIMMIVTLFIVYLSPVESLIYLN